jgi:hypothetical protein
MNSDRHRGAFCDEVMVVHLGRTRVEGEGEMTMKKEVTMFRYLWLGLAAVVVAAVPAHAQSYRWQLDTLKNQQRGDEIDQQYMQQQMERQRQQQQEQLENLQRQQQRFETEMRQRQDENETNAIMRQRQSDADQAQFEASQSQLKNEMQMREWDNKLRRQNEEVVPGCASVRPCIGPPHPECCNKHPQVDMNQFIHASFFWRTTARPIGAVTTKGHEDWIEL